MYIILTLVYLFDSLPWHFLHTAQCSVPSGLGRTCNKPQCPLSFSPVSVPGGSSSHISKSQSPVLPLNVSNLLQTYLNPIGCGRLLLARVLSMTHLQTLTFIWRVFLQTLSCIILLHAASWLWQLTILSSALMGSFHTLGKLTLAVDIQPFCLCILSHSTLSRFSSF